MLICFYPAALKFVDEHIDRRSVLVARYDNAVDGKVVAAESIYEPQHLKVVRYPEVVTRFARSYIARVNADYNLGFVLHLLEKFNFGVLVKARKNSHRMLIVNKLSSEFEIKPFSLMFFNSFEDISGLLVKIFFRVKTDFPHCPLLTESTITALFLYRVRFAPPPAL